MPITLSSSFQSALAIVGAVALYLSQQASLVGPKGAAWLAVLAGVCLILTKGEATNIPGVKAASSALAQVGVKGPTEPPASPAADVKV